jgi:pimeloyl-ACP methyl ester carboxylesterase
MKTQTVLFIHGMFMTSACWEGWVRFFEAKGYRCLAPNWPGRDEPVETLRSKHPDPELGKLTLTRVVEYHADIINKLAEKPVIIGHSMGALVTQILINRGLGAAGVAIDSAPPVGVFTPAWSFLKANFPMIDPFVSKTRPHLMTFPQFQYAFVNSMPLAEQQAAYERYVVPESRQVPQESLLGSIARIDFKKAHAPLLLTAGSIDHIIPAALNRTNYTRYQSSPSVTDFKEFPGRTHFQIGQPGWEEIAGYIVTWLDKIAS